MRLDFRRARIAIGLCAGVFTTLALAGPAEAYKLKTACSQTGTDYEKWDTSRPIQVRLLAPSATWMFDRYDQRYDAADIAQLHNDISAVIDLYNAIPGLDLTLELGPGLTASSDLAEPEDVNYGDQTIVIGFAKREHKNSPNAEAWAAGARDFGAHDVTGCTRTRAHLVFRKKVKWVFGPPPHTDVDGRHFNPEDKPDADGFHTFLGILVHEMGHALALGHPENDYAILAQSFNTWFRGEDHAIAPGLLPDDIAALRVLYGDGSPSDHVDISLTNSWVKLAEQHVNACDTEEAVMAAAQQAWFDAIAAGEVGTPGFVEVAEAFGDAVDDFERCEDGKNATQVENCRISSRGDGWADKIDELAYCGAHEDGSPDPDVSNQVCPGDDLQVRYTLNNNALDRDIHAKMRLWLSPDTELNLHTGRAAELRSPDLREFTIRGGKSALLGHIFEVPAEAIPRDFYYVFVRALPFDPETGNGLKGRETDLWNNAIMVRSRIKIKADC